MERKRRERTNTMNEEIIELELTPKELCILAEAMDYAYFEELYERPEKALAKQLVDYLNDLAKEYKKEN